MTSLHLLPNTRDNSSSVIDGGLSQFVRLRGFPRVCRKRKDKKIHFGKRKGEDAETPRNYIEILSEASRVEGFCSHIPGVKAPILLYGVEPVDLITEIDDSLIGATDASNTRAINKHTRVLLAAIFSYPIPKAQVLASKQLLSEFNRWVDETQEFSKEIWGDRLRSSVLHIDEGQYHIHSFVVPDFKNGDKNLDKYHPAMRAEAEACSKSDASAEANYKRQAAGSKALTEFQDSYYSRVSKYFGHMRVGSASRRLTRHQRNLEKTQARALREVAIEAEVIRQESHTALRRASELAKKIKQEADRDRAEAARLRVETEQLFRKAKELADYLQECAGWIQRNASSIPTRVKTFFKNVATAVSYLPPSR